MFRYQQHQYDIDDASRVVSTNILKCKQDILRCQDEINHVSQKIKALEEKCIELGGPDHFVRKEELLMSEKALLMSEKALLMRKDESLMSEKALLISEKRALAEIIEHTEYLHMSDTPPPKGGLNKSIDEMPIAQDYRSFRYNQDSVYMVDKTHLIPHLLLKFRVVYRRPRRFGKSLLLSTLKYFFFGAPELFNGLSIYDKEMKSFDFTWSPRNPEVHYFPPCPVVSLDFSSCSTLGCLEDGKKFLHSELQRIAQSNGISDLPSIGEPATSLGLLIRSLSSQKYNEWKRCVILIDEYDSLVRLARDLVLKEQILHLIAEMFRVIKSNDDKIVFSFVTGIQSHTMAGIYSGANNFVDMTYDPLFHSLCGHTIEETVACLTALNLPTDNIEALQKQYNGYSFSLSEDDANHPRQTLFNPYFISRYSQSKRLDDYWSHTASLGLMKEMPLVSTLNMPIRCRLDWLKQAGKLRQDDRASNEQCRALIESGYGTIASVHANEVIVDYPNEGIKIMVQTGFVDHFCSVPSRQKRLLDVCESLDSGDFVPLIRLLNEFIAQTPYWYSPILESEAGWMSLLNIFLNTAAAKFISEESSMLGRSDIVLLTRNGIWILECKCGLNENITAADLSANYALDQIMERRYQSGKFVKENDQHPVYHVAVVGDKVTRQFTYIKFRDPTGITKDTQHFFASLNSSSKRKGKSKKAFDKQV